MLDKINITGIIKDHLNTLKDFKKVKERGGDFKSAPYCTGDLIIFFFLPCLFAIILLYFKLLLNMELANVLITSLSVFAALLFNLLLLIYDISIRNKINDKDKHTLIGQIYSNISFSIFIAIITIIILIIYFLTIGSMHDQYLNINSIDNTTIDNKDTNNTYINNININKTYLNNMTIDNKNTKNKITNNTTIDNTNINKAIANTKTSFDLFSLNYYLMLTYIFSFLSYYSIILFILTLFMVLKRINLLLWEEIK